MGDVDDYDDDDACTITNGLLSDFERWVGFDECLFR